MRRFFDWLIIDVVAVAIIVCIFGFIASARAEINIPDTLAKIPGLNQAVIYSISDSKWDYATSITCITLWKERIKLDVGYTPRQEMIGLASIKLVSIKDYIKFPILDKVEIEPFVYIGAKRLGVTEAQNEFDWGCGIKILEVKF